MLAFTEQKPYIHPMHEYYRYCHLFNRGVDKRLIFQDESDYVHMYVLFARYLAPTPSPNTFKGGFYPNFYSSLRLLAFCLMPNHFHLEVEELEAGAVSRLMHHLKTAYTRYFNEKTSRSGSLFESRYHYKEIFSTEGLISVSRYIHLNPLALTMDYEHYPYSSMRYYLGEPAPSWLSTDLISGYFCSFTELHDFHEAEIRHRASVANAESQVELAAAAKVQLGEAVLLSS